MKDFQAWDIDTLSRDWTALASRTFTQRYKLGHERLLSMMSSSTSKYKKIVSSLDAYLKSHADLLSYVGGLKYIVNKLNSPTTYVSIIDVFPIFKTRGDFYWLSNRFSNYYRFIDYTVDQWNTQFVANDKDYNAHFIIGELHKCAILPGRANSLTKAAHTITALKSFPIIPSVSDEKFISRRAFTRSEKLISQLVMDVFTNGGIYDAPNVGFSLPKDSSVGYPLCVNDDDVKRKIATSILRDHSTKILDILDRLNPVENVKQNQELLSDLFMHYGITRISIGGERTQIDNNSDDYIKKRPFNIGVEAFTIPDCEIVSSKYHGYGAKRLRSVDGLSFNTNLLANYILKPLRDFYGHEYGAVYKTRGADELTSLFSNALFIYGSDVTQLDNNIHPERITFYNSYLINKVDDKYRRAVSNLFRMIQYPCKFIKPLGGVYDKPIIINDPFTYPSDDLLSRHDEHGTGLPSGSAFTSEIGKCEMTCYYFIQFYNACLLHKTSADFRALIKQICSDMITKGALDKLNIDDDPRLYISHKDLLDSCDFNLSKYISSLRTFQQFIRNLLSNHLDGQLIFKNCGDDTVFASNATNLPLLIALILMIIRARPYDATKAAFDVSTGIFKYISSEYGKSIFNIIKEGSYCDWHQIDAEEPVSYLGFQCYHSPSNRARLHKFEFFPNLNSLFINTFLPEYSQSRGVKKYTFGIGGLAKLDYYMSNPYANRALSIINNSLYNILGSRFSIQDTYNLYENFIKGGEFLTNKQINYTNLSDEEKMFISNPESIYYKVSESSIRSDLLNLYLLRIGESDTEALNKLLFRPFNNINIRK